jgi:hypothetical protein
MKYNWCYTWDMDVDQYNLLPFIDKNKKDNKNYWAIWERGSFSHETFLLRTMLEEHIGPIEYMGVWDYFEGFVDDQGPHIDGGSIDSAVIFLCPRGELTVTLHDKETKKILDTKVLNNTNAMSLYHTKFMHDIKGVGDLIVFGLSKNFNAESYFLKKDIQNETTI